jgi:hypothetical protein
MGNRAASLTRGRPSADALDVRQFARPVENRRGQHTGEHDRRDIAVQHCHQNSVTETYHGSDDETAPVAHLALYERAIPGAKTRRLPGRDHQFDNDLSEVAADIRRLPRISHTPYGLRCSFGEVNATAGGEKHMSPYG